MIHAGDLPPALKGPRPCRNRCPHEEGAILSLLRDRPCLTPKGEGGGTGLRWQERRFLDFRLGEAANGINTGMDGRVKGMGIVVERHDLTSISSLFTWCL